MGQNKLRELLKADKPSVATRVENQWPLMEELIGSLGLYDYIEYVAEYSPFNQYDLENIARAAELHNLGTMIKVDFQNRAYVCQKAMAAGIQAIMFTDHKTAEEVVESLFAVNPDTPQHKGRFGYPNRRWIGYNPSGPQMDYAEMVHDTVKCFMIEKYEAVDNIDAICSVPGVDMVQFGPSDYSMSRGWNSSEHVSEFKDAEKKMIKSALAHGVQPRCEIYTPDAAKYYLDLGVRHFCIGDELKNAADCWTAQGKGLRALLK